MKYSRIEIAKLIVEKLLIEKEQLRTQYFETKKQIGFFYLDNLLPDELAREIYKSFPTDDEAILKKNLREYKYVAYQMDAYHPILKEVIYAFQEERVVKLIEEICDLKSVFPDENLYAGGLSIMKKDHFLNPHLDNSHDKDRNNWRVLNLLYYVTPNWEESFGGNLEIWPNGVKNSPITIPSTFNRLVVMATHQKSWHSVSKVLNNVSRRCVSNYYFSNNPVHINDKFHVTSFRGRPSEKLRDVILKIDTNLRMTLRNFFKKGVKENTHKYRRK